MEGFFYEKNNQLTLFLIYFNFKVNVVGGIGGSLFMLYCFGYVI